MTPLRDRLQSSLGDAFRLERELDGGGPASVFLARDVALGRPVVVKTLPAHVAADLSAERFARTVVTIAPLEHAHIVPVLAAGVVPDAVTSHHGVPYYVTPHVEGASLRERLRGASGGLPLPEAVSILRDVARALDHAHARGVVHRDVKPDNVLLGRAGAAVTDFGVAKAIDHATRDGAPPDAFAPQSAGTAITRVGHAVGTPGYMAPEQVAADPSLDHRADLYAWGVVAHELLAGAPPFTAPSARALLAATLSAAPPPLDGRRPDVPPALSAVVARCLEKAPARRPSSARVLLSVLE